jgi:hypothetical protein
MRKISFGIASLLVALTLSGCAPARYDESKWIDDSASYITLDLSGAIVDKGFSSAAKNKIEEVSEVTNKREYTYGKGAGWLGTVFYNKEKENTFITSTVGNPLLSIDSVNLKLREACEIDGYAYLDKNLNAMDLFKELVDTEIDFSISLYDAVVLIDNAESFPFVDTKTRVIILKHDKNNLLKSISIAYVKDHFKGGEDFASYFNSYLKDENKLYVSGGMKFDYEQYYADVEADSTVYQVSKIAPKSGLVNISQTSLADTPGAEYTVNSIDYNEAASTCSVTKVGSFQIKFTTEPY